MVGLTLHFNKVYFDCTILCLLSCEMPINFEMFCLIVEDWVCGNFNATLIVAPKRNQCIAFETKFSC